jgi:SNF2 family DNA or RNA helicase
VTTFTPRPYQITGMQHITDNPRCALWAGMGMGKTVTTMTTLDNLALVEDCLPALVIAPKRVAVSTWPDEAAKWGHLSHLRVVPITGSVAERRRAIHTPADIHTINYENLPWLIETVGDDWKWHTVVADEATKLKGFRLRQGSSRARALGKVAHAKVTRFIELTGTPSPQGLIDLWGQSWFLDAGVRLGRTFSSFEQRWFKVGRDGYGLEPMPFAQDEIPAKLADLCLTLDPADYFDLKAPIITNIEVDLPARAREQYKDMEKEMFALIDGNEIEAFSAAARSQKLLQLASGAIYTDEKATAWTQVHDAKIEALHDVIEEAAGAPVLVSYYFRHTLARLLEAFPKARKLDADPQTIRDWNAGKIQILLAHPKSAGHGLNLQDGGHHIALIDHDWNLEEYLQILERIGPVRQLQAGHNRHVFIYNIIARDTIDRLVIARRESKRAVQDLLLDYMKGEA